MKQKYQNKQPYIYRTFLSNPLKGMSKNKSVKIFRSFYSICTPLNIDNNI